MTYSDFLTNVEEALLRVIASNTMLHEYNINRWDSDKEVKLPRVNVELDATRDVEHSPLFRIGVIITLEGKPRRQKLSGAQYELESLMGDDALCPMLQLHTDKVFYYGNAAEQIRIQRRIDGDIRKLVLSCNIYAGPQV